MRGRYLGVVRFGTAISGLPPRCGDGTAPSPKGEDWQAVHPRDAGTVLECVVDEASLERLTPAMRGRYLIHLVHSHRQSGSPPRCGEYPVHERGSMWVNGSPPPVRGIHRSRDVTYRSVWSTPAMREQYVVPNVLAVGHHGLPTLCVGDTVS